MQGADPTSHTLAAAYSDPFPTEAPLRLVVFADNFGASQSIAFIEGLQAARSDGRAAVSLVEEAAFGPDQGLRDCDGARELAQAEMERTSATTVVLSRFGHSGAYEGIRQAAAARGLGLHVHIDDDLFDLPVTAGIERYRVARHPRRIQTLHRSLCEAEVVIAATGALADRVARMTGHARIGWLENGTAGRPWPRRAGSGGPLVIGYMGSASHGPDLEMVVPALTAVLTRHPDIRVELFGSIARQPAADLLPGAVVRHDVVVGDYSAFKAKLMGLGWDIGLAPLLATPYNRCKTATKWTEYAEAGIAVVASDIEVYQPMFAAGAAMAASPKQWAHALEGLIRSPDLRRGLIGAADQLLASRFGWERLEASVLALLQRGYPQRAAA